MARVQKIKKFEKKIPATRQQEKSSDRAMADAGSFDVGGGVMWTLKDLIGDGMGLSETIEYVNPRV